LFYTIMYFHEKNPLAYNIAEWNGYHVLLGSVDTIMSAASFVS
jgi:hypothetical protein